MRLRRSLISAPRGALHGALLAALVGGALGAVAQAQPAAPASPAPSPPSPTPAAAAPASPPPAAAAPASPPPAASAPSPSPPAAPAPSAPSAAAQAHRDDPRALFGLPPRREQAPGCGEPDDTAAVLGGSRRPAPRRDECALDPDPLAERSPLSLGTWWGGVTLARLPVADAVHDGQAAFALGVGRDDGGAVIAGASSLENRWTVDGAPVDSVRTGGADTRLPLAFLAGLRVTTGGFSARDRASSGGVIDAELVRGGDEHAVTARAWAGLSGRRRDRPVLPGSFNVMRGRVVDPRFTTATVVASGPLPGVLGARLWYAAGVAPTLTDISFAQEGVRLLDRNNDGEPDLAADGGFLTEPISRHTSDVTAFSAPLMARLGLERHRQSLELTVLGQWAQSARFLNVATAEATTIERDTALVDGIATWRRRWDRTALRVQIAWHRSARGEAAADERAGELPQLQTAFIPAADSAPTLDPRISAACDDEAQDDRYPRIINCPVPTGWFARQGVGLLTDVTTDRPSFAVDAVRQLAGPLDGHAVRAGALGEDARMVIDTRYSGGRLLRSLFPGHSETVQLVDGEGVEECAMNIDVPCPTLPAISLTYRTRHLAAYLEDTWRPRPDLLIDFGVRWEYQQLGSRLKLADNLAPRAGVAWDPLGRGRSRVAATFARTFTYLPAGLGELIDKTPATLRDITFDTSRARVIESGFLSRVQPDVGAMTTDELAFSAEIGWPRLGRLRLQSQHRWLRAGFEDTDLGFGNPGGASRRVDLVGVELATSPFTELTVRVGYARGQAQGSLVGAYDPRRGAILYGSSDFNELATNAAGTLPSDLGHRFYADLARQRRFGKDLAVEGGARLGLASGRPRSVIGDSGLWGPIYLLPRGSAERLPAVLSTDLRLAARFRATSLSLEVQNLFSRETATATDETYASGLYSPIDGGDASDLTFLKTVTGVPARRSLSYGTATAYQAPVVVVLGLESQF